MTLTRPAAAQVLTRVQADPEWFLLHVLGWEPTPAAKAHGYTSGITPDQQRIVQAVRDHRRVAVPAGHGVGKTHVIAGLVLWFLYAFPGSKIVTTAPSWFQVENLLWREIRTAFLKARVPLGGTLLQTSLNLGDDWFAVGLSTDEPTRFQGIHAPRVMVLIDEATGVQPDIWDAGEGLAVGRDDRLVAVGNPTDPGSRFKQVCDNPLWHVERVSSADHPNVIHRDPDIVPGAVTWEWVGEHIEEYGGDDSPLARARIFGKWPEQGPDMLIALAWVEAAQARWAAWAGASQDRDARARPDVIACDVARFGSDETILAGVWPGGFFDFLKITQGQDTMRTAGDLIHFAVPSDEAIKAGASAVPLVVDDGGVGGGVTDRVREQDVTIQAVNFGENPSPHLADRFVNRRAEMYWSLREHLRLGSLALPPDPRLTADLTNLKYSYDSRGRVQLEKKDDFKKRMKRSPDRGDTAAMAAWGWRGMARARVGWLE